jgi:hypothetical protein
VFLQLPLVIVLALASWISAMDATGDPTATWWLCTATAVAGSFFLFTLLARKR